MKNLYGALLNVQKLIGSVKKDEKNPFFKSTYASLNSVRDSVIGPLTENGIVLTQPTVFIEGRSFVKTTLTHASSGEVAESFTEVITKVPGDAQQAGSGISYARRYGLMSMLCLAADDDDGNAATGKSSEVAKVSAIAEPKAVAKPVTTEAATVAPKRAPFKKVTENTGDDI